MFVFQKNTNHVGQAPTRGISIGMNLEELKKLAGITEFKGYTEYTLENFSDAANANRKTEREQNIQPGTEEWFKLWFGLPKMHGQMNTPQGFRGRKK